MSWHSAAPSWRRHFPCRKPARPGCSRAPWWTGASRWWSGASAATRAALVGEVGLDSGSQVPLDLQLQTFRQVLKVVQDLPRLTSIHSYQTCSLLLDELIARPISAPVLHWWTGTASETRQAVELGCYFSIHSQVARQSKWRTQVPLERVLVESDHGYEDPPPAIPHRVAWVEYLVAQQYRIGVQELRRQVWTNFARLIRLTHTLDRLPDKMAELVISLPV